MSTTDRSGRQAATWGALALAIVVTSAASAVGATLVTSKQIKDHTIQMVDINQKTAKTLRYSTVPSGVTIRGVWGALLQPVDATRDYDLEFVSFPLALPKPLKDANVKFGTKGVNGSVSAVIQSAINDADESASCTGNFRRPTAPKGMLCIYVRDSFGPINVFAGTLSADAPESDGTPGPNKYGFVIGWEADNVSVPSRTEGTWAYTAP